MDSKRLTELALDAFGFPCDADGYAMEEGAYYVARVDDAETCTELLAVVGRDEAHARIRLAACLVAINALEAIRAAARDKS